MPYGNSIVKNTEGIEWEEPSKLPTVRDTSGIEWDEPAKPTITKKTSGNLLLETDFTQKPQYGLPPQISEDVTATKPAFAPEKIATPSKNRAYQQAKAKSVTGLPTEREVQLEEAQLSRGENLELGEDGKPVSGALEYPWVSPDFALAGWLRAASGVLTKAPEVVAQGKGFLAGSIGGDVAAWTAHETVDKSLTDDFKKQHPVLSETMKVTAALAGGVAGGMAAERRYMQQYQSLIDDVKEGTITPQKAEIQLSKDSNVRGIITKVEGTRAKFAEERAATQPPPEAPIMDKVNAKLKEMGHEPVQVQRIKAAQEIPVGGSEDAAKEAVKQLFKKAPDSEYKKMTEADRQAYDEEYQRSLEYGPKDESGMPMDDFGQPLFSKGDEPDLIVQHNLSEDNLAHAKKMGGIAVPSLAVVKHDQPLTGFGEITMIGPKELADPKGYAKTKVFGADIYSPRYPSVKKQFTTKDEKNIINDLSPFMESVGRKSYDIDMDNLVDNIALKAKFLESKGITPPLLKETAPKEYVDKLKYFEDVMSDDELTMYRSEAFRERVREWLGPKVEKYNEEQLSRMYDGYARDLLSIDKKVKAGESGKVDFTSTRQAINDQIDPIKDEYKKFAEDYMAKNNAQEKIYGGTDRMGRQKWIPHNLDNVIKKLKADLRGGENFNYGTGSLRAKYTPQFKSVKEIKAAKGKLVNREDFEVMKKDIEDEFFTVADDLKSSYEYSADGFRYTEAVQDMLGDAATMGLSRAFKEHGWKNVPEDVVNSTSEFMNKLRNMPTEYFEAKVMREVSPAEFHTAIVPDNAKPETIQQLKDQGVKIQFYKRGDEADRKRAIREAAQASKEDVMFADKFKSTDGTTTKEVETLAKKFLGKQYDTLRKDMNIVQTFNDLPADLKKRTGLDTIDVGGKPRGIYDPKTGKAHLIADAMSNKEVQSVIAHELLHRHINSGRQVLGANYDTFVLRLKQLKNDPLVKEAMDAVRSAGTPVRHMNEETMAYLVEKYQYSKDISPKLQQFIKDIVERIKVFIAEIATQLGIKPEWLISKMSADEIAQVLKSAAIKSEKSVVKEAEVMKSSLFSTKDLAKELSDIFSKYGIEQQVTSDNLGNFVFRIKDMLDKGSKFKGGDDASIDLKRFIENFMSRYNKNLNKFLEDSVVTSKVYHGSNVDFQTFEPKESTRGFGIFQWKTKTPAFFFTENKSVAREFGEAKADVFGGKLNIIEGYISLKNPLDLSKVTVKNKSILSKAGYEFQEGTVKSHTLWDAIDNPEVVANLKTMGYDGAVLNEGKKFGISYAVFSPTQIKSTQNIGTFSETDPNILFSKAKEVIDQMPEGFRKKEAKADLLELKTVQKNYDNFKEWFRQTFHDMYRPIVKMQQSVGVDEGSMIKWDVAGHRLVERSKAKFEMERINERVEDIEKRIVASAKKLEAQPDELRHLIDQYLISKHAPEYNKAIGEDLLGGAAGRSTQEAKEIVKAIGANREVYREVRQFAKEMQAMAKESLDVLLDSGVLNKEQYATIKGKYKYYVPMHRVMPDDKDIRPLLGGSGTNVKGTGIKKRVGSQTLEVADIMSNIMFTTKSAIDRANKNKNANRLYELLQQIKNPHSPMHNSEYANMFEIGSPKVVGMDSNGIPIMQHIADDKRTLFFRVDGKPKFIKFKNQALADAALEHDYYMYLPVVAEISRWMGAMYTRFNVGFAPRNFVRDTQEMGIFLSSLPDMGYKGAAKASSLAPKALKGVMEDMFNKDTEWGRLYRQLQEDGGVMGGYHALSKKDIEVNVDEIFKEAQDIRANTEGAKRVLKNIFGVVDGWNQIFEDSNRLAAYKSALDMGISRDRAAWIARNATIDFDRKGQVTRMLSQLYIFFNPSIQGTAKLFRALKNPKVAVPVTASVGSAVFALNAYNDSIDKDWRKKVSPYDLKSSLVILVPGKEFSYMVVPLAWGVRPIYQAFSEAYSFTKDEVKDISDRIGEVAKTFFDAYSPIQGNTFLSTLTPTVLDPLVDVYTNEKSLGGMIRPDWMKELPQSEQVFKKKGEEKASIDQTASGRIMHMTTEGLSDIGVEFSPHDLDYALGSYFGGPYKLLKQGIDNLVAPITGDKVPPQGKPIIGDFYKKPEPEIIEKREKGKPYRELVKKLNKVEPLERKILIVEYLNKVEDGDQRKSVLFKLQSGGYDTKGISPSAHPKFPVTKRVNGKIKQVTKDDIMLYHLRNGASRTEAKKLAEEWEAQ